MACLARFVFVLENAALVVRNYFAFSALLRLEDSILTRSQVHVLDFTAILFVLAFSPFS